MEQVQPEKSKLLQQLQELDIDSMTPRDALDCLYELKKLSEKSNYKYEIHMNGGVKYG